MDQPNFILVFGEASGTAITNYGSEATSYAINQNTPDSSKYAWHTDTDAKLSRLESLLASGASMPYLATTATTPGAALQTINFSIKFRLTTLSSSGTLLCRTGASGGSTAAGDLSIAASDNGSGGFNLTCSFYNSGSAHIDSTGTEFNNLSFGTDYVLSCSLDPGTVTAVQARFKLDANTVNAPATANWTSFDLRDAWPYCLIRNDFLGSPTFGMTGYLYWWVYQRGGTFWSSADLDSINSDIAVALSTWWPGAGGGAGRLIGGSLVGGTLLR